MMQITNVICPTSKYSIKCPYDMVPEFIIIHNTANDASAMAEVSYMIGNDYKTSFHVAVDNERVVTGIPFNRNTYNAGDGRNGNGNRKGIAIEICYSKTGGEKFEEAENLCASYVALLLRKYGWGIEKVKKHQDFSGKYCPHRTLDIGWERFLNKIRVQIEEQKKEAPVINEGGNLEMPKIYQNGSTPETVYCDTNLSKKIGTLNPWEKCEYLAIDNNRPLVRYKVDGTNIYKVGYVLYKGGAI